MMKKFTGGRLFFDLCIIVYALFIAGYCLYSHYEAKSSIMSAVDEKLLMGARCVDGILPPDFHDRFAHNANLPPMDRALSLEALSQFSDAAGYKHLYTIVRAWGRFYLGAASSSENERKAGKLLYFSAYRELAKVLPEVFRQNKPFFMSFSDSKGAYRTCLVPQTSPGGVKYLSCAEYDVSYVDQMLRGNLLRSIFTALCFVAASIPLILSYRWLRNRHAAQLEAINAELLSHKEHLEELVQKRTGELKFQAELLDQIQDQIAAVDLDGRIIYANKAMRRRRGSPEHEVAGRRLSEFSDSWDFEGDMGDLLEKVKDRGFWREEITSRAENGARQYWDVRGWLIHDELGRPRGVCGAATDVTENRILERQVRQSRETYKSILENMREGYIELDLAGNLTFCNDSFAKIMQAPKDELVGANYVDFVDEASADALFEIYNNVYLTGEPADEVRCRVLSRQGGIKTLRVSATLIFDEKGAPRGFRGVALDITRRVRAEEALMESEKRIRSLIEHSPLPMMVMDQNSDIQYLNEKFVSIFGYTVEDVPNFRDWLELAYPDDDYRKQVAEAWKEAVRNAEHADTPIITRERTIRCRDGANRTMEIVASIVGDFKFLIFNDVTERRRMLEDLKRLASTDPLTGAYNRRKLLQKGAEEFVRSKRYGAPLSFLMMDIDHFKRINDTYGHHAGDKVLKLLSEKCRDEIRETDSFGRVGGEEFAVLLIESDIEQGIETAQRLRQAVENLSVRVDDKTIRFTVSIGAACLEKQDQSLESLMNRADRALYMAKKSGRNRVFQA